MFARLWRRWRQWCERRQQVWPVPNPEPILAPETQRRLYQDAADRHGGRSVYACVNGDAALFMGPAEYEALDYLRKELHV